MRRRAFLGGLAAAPWWIRRAFADASVSGAELHRAAPARPTLVFVVPHEEAERWDRGAAFGELLNYGSDGDLYPLGVCDVVCAPADDFGVQGNALLVFAHGATVQAYYGKLPQYADRERDGDANDAAVSEQRIALLSRLIRHAFAQHVDDRSHPTAEYAAIARRRYVAKAPPGARWGHAGGCGTRYEGERSDAEMPDCGMGHVPAKSARFLDFLVKA